MSPGATRDRPKLGDLAAARLRADIIAGELPPGRRVRPEDLGRELGISATPAREGLQQLRVEGFVRLVPGHGFVVAELTGDDVRDLFIAQALLAGELAGRAAVRGTETDRAELLALHHELSAAAARRDLDLLEERNDAFHRHINRMAGSRRIAGALGLLTRYVPRRFYPAIPGWPEATVADHAEILDAVLRGDGERARRAMDEHIRHAGDLLAEHFDRRVADEGR